MHQQPRRPPRVSAGANVTGGDSVASSANERAIVGASIKKLDQIVQNYFSKIAAVVIGSRMDVQPMRNANGLPKTSKWFQIETDEMDDFKDELRTYKYSGTFERRPPPLIIETYLDTSCLKDSQSLVVVDDNGKRWDVMEQLNSSESSFGSYGAVPPARTTEVLLERWRIDLEAAAGYPAEDFGSILPTLYKKAIVFFRSLFIITRILPAWKFASQRSTKNAHPALVPRCRIRVMYPFRPGTDLLRHPIDGRREPVANYAFSDLETPIGPLRTVVTYRSDCNFRIDDSESLLSSRFMGVDHFKPSIPQAIERFQGQNLAAGSLREHSHGNAALSEPHQMYGSMSTFHGQGHLGTSPLSALKATRPPRSDTGSSPAVLPQSTALEVIPGSSMPTSARISVPRTGPGRPDSAGRRTSISFQPFKAGSLSGSPVPLQLEPESVASAYSQTRPSGSLIGSQSRNRSSLTAGMAASLRGGPPTVAADSPVIGSPRPGSTGRYSSSFTHRRGRMSVSRAGDDEQSSSGRQSLASSVAQPGSGLLAEGGGGGTSSGSLQADGDDIADFLKALDSRKTLKSLESSGRGESATKRTVAQLSKFHLMRDSNNALTESMTSSMQMQRSSSSSSRQLTSVPGMVAAASMSTSSSPGKPVSPHTPHTPAIPSRLSENSIIDYESAGRITSRGGRRQAPPVSEASRESTVTQQGTTAIDIPLSPQLISYQRRSSSAAQQSRAVIDDEETDLAFAHRSVSLGAEPPTVSNLLDRRLQTDHDAAVREDVAVGSQPVTQTQPCTASMSDVLQTDGNEDNLPSGLIPSIARAGSAFPRRRQAGLGGSAGSKYTPPQSTRGSFTGSLSRLGRADDESVGEEPLVFDLSEMDAQGRRSLEEGQGGHNASAERSAFEPRGTSRRGW